MLLKREKTAIFIDGSNLHATARVLGFDIDYQKLLKYFQKETNVIRAYYYTALFEGHDYSPLKPLVDWLDYNGYHMTTKTAKEYTDTQGKLRVRGSINVELAVDAMEIADKIEHAILFTGDSDFSYLIEALQRKAVRVSVVSTLKSQPPMVTDKMRRLVDNFIDLADIKMRVSRKAHGGSTGYKSKEVAEDKDIDDVLKDKILEGKASGIDWDNEFE